MVTLEFIVTEVEVDDLRQALARAGWNVSCPPNGTRFPALLQVIGVPEGVQKDVLAVVRTHAPSARAQP